MKYLTWLFIIWIIVVTIKMVELEYRIRKLEALGIKALDMFPPLKDSNAL